MQAPARKPALVWSRLLVWLGPSVLLLLIYWHGLRAWFQMDDFAWLSLHLDVVDFRSFLAALFRPLAQGTIRPWSERLFFLAGWHLFGMEAAPYRAIVFATMCANLSLLTALTRRITGSDIAAFVAPVLWIANGNLYTPMAWTSAYNQVLCAFFLLAALLLWVRYTETGDRRLYLWQWLVFIAGFGALEINLVYPVLAALHAFCSARRYLTRTLPMFLVSAAFVLAHRLAAPPIPGDTYRMYFDPSILQGLGTYLAWSVSAHRYASFRNLELWPFYTSAVLAGSAIVVVSIRLLWRKDRLPWFCFGWFAAVIAPVLPLRNHRSDYYLTIAVIGFAILGGYGIALGWRSRVTRILAAGVALVYAVPGAWMAHGMSGVFREHSTRVKHLVRGVAGAARQHPGKVLLISGIDNELFWRAWYDEVFRTLGIDHVYLSQKDAHNIRLLRKSAALGRFFLADTIALHLLVRGDARVYRLVPDGRLRDANGLTLARLQRTTLDGPGYLDPRSQVSAVHLGFGWWPPEQNHRWMAARASLELRGPASEPGELILRGICTPWHVQSGPVHLSVSVDGIALPPRRIDEHNLDFQLKYPLPAVVTGKPLMHVELMLDRPVVLPGDGRELGAAFGALEVKP